MRREQRRKLLFAIPGRLPLPLPSATGAPSLGGGANARYPSMVRLARCLWVDAEAGFGIRVLTPTALLSLGPHSISSVLAAIENAGAEEVDLAARWGGAFRAPDCWIAAVSERGSGVLHASKSVEMFQALAVKKGAVVRDNAEVVDIMKGLEGGVVVKTRTGEEFTGAKCVVTVGVWTYWPMSMRPSSSSAATEAWICPTEDLLAYVYVFLLLCEVLHFTRFPGKISNQQKERRCLCIQIGIHVAEFLLRRSFEFGTSCTMMVSSCRSKLELSHPEKAI